MNNPIEQSVAITIQMGPALDAGDGVAEETGLSPTVELSKAHAAFAARDSASAINHDANGWYRVPLNTTDVATVGRLIAKFDDAAIHLPVWHEFTVVPANVYDSLVGGTDALQVHANEITADLINSTAIASAAIADQAVVSVAGNVDGNVVGSVASVSGSVGSIAANGLNSTSVKSGALAGETIAAVSGNVAGNVVGTVASVTGNVDGNIAGSVASVSGNVTGSVGSLAAQAKTDVNAEVVDVIKTDTIAEQAQGVPPATPTLEQAAGYLYMALRNEVTVDANDKTFANDAGTVIHKKALSDDATTYTEAKSVSGP